jgi:hypothetical protein
MTDMDEVDSLDAYMAGIDKEVELLGTAGKNTNDLPIVSRDEEEASESEEDVQVDSEMLKNLSVEEMLAYI